MIKVVCIKDCYVGWLKEPILIKKGNIYYIESIRKLSYVTNIQSCIVYDDQRRLGLLPLCNFDAQFFITLDEWRDSQINSLLD